MNDPKLEIMLKEYETLRAEIIERLKLAYQQLGWAGAAIAFAIPLAVSDITPSWYLFCRVVAAFLGVIILVWLSALNWLWLRNCGDHLRRIEAEVEKHSGGIPLLTWERRASKLSNGVLRKPKRPLTVEEHIPYLGTEACPRSEGVKQQPAQ